MMAVASSTTQATPLSRPATALPDFYNKQTFRVITDPKAKAKTTAIVKIVSVFKKGGLPALCFTVNGATAQALSVEQFCLKYPDRVQIAS